MLNEHSKIDYRTSHGILIEHPQIYYRTSHVKMKERKEKNRKRNIKINKRK